MDTTTEYADLDPAEVLIDANARTNARQTITKEWVESIGTLGVIIPVLCVRETPGDKPKIRDGERRVLGAIDAGVTSIPAIIVTGPGADDQAARIQQQLVAGLFQERLSTADTAAAVAALFDLGVPAKTVKAATGLGRKATTQARAVAASTDALDAARKHTNLSLDEAAAIAEFDDDPETKKRLLGYAGTGSFVHVAEIARRERTSAAAFAKAKAEAEADGFQVVSWEQRGGELYNLLDGEGKSLDDETHADCPGRAVQLQPHQDGARTTYTRRGYCTQPDLHGRREGTMSPKRQPGTPMSQAEKDERKQVIHNNKWWRAATAIRRAWLAEFAKAKKGPADVQAWLLEMLARADYEMSRQWKYCPPGLEALGIDPDDDKERENEGYSSAPAGKGPVLAMLAKATGPRAQVIAATLLLGAYESDLSPDDGWRSVTPSRKRYMERLEAWGYPVSDVERCLLDGRLDRWVHHPDGEVTFLKTDEQVAAETKRAEEQEARMAALRDGEPGDPCPRCGRSHFPWCDEGEQTDLDAAAVATSELAEAEMAEAGEWPRLVGGHWVDRPGNPVTDPDDELVIDGDGAAYHLAPEGDPEE